MYTWCYWYQVTPTAAATVSQQLSQPGRSQGVSRTGIKYPVRGIPHSDIIHILYLISYILYLIPQTALCCRGSDGFGKGAGGVESPPLRPGSLPKTHTETNLIEHVAPKTGKRKKKKTWFLPPAAGAPTKKLEKLLFLKCVS